MKADCIASAAEDVAVRMPMKRALSLASIALSLCLSCGRGAGALQAAAPAPAAVGLRVSLRLVAFNDVHGHLLPDAAESRVRYGHGGVTNLAREVRALRASARNSLVLSAGDLFGASPLLSSMYDHIPTVEAMNALGLDVAAVGNHEFDRGVPAMRQALASAKFAVLGANVWGAEGRAFPGYAVRDVEGIPVAFIGLTTRDTRTLVLGERIEGLRFDDEADSVNALVDTLRPRGIEAFVVLIHEGGTQHGGMNDCHDLKGRIGGIVAKFSSAVDVVVSGHTHAAYNCVLSGKPVTSALSYARMVTRLDLQLDPRSHDVVQVDAENVVVPDGPADAAVEAAILPYVRRAEPVLSKVVGRIQSSFVEHPNEHGESPLGSLVADAQWEATKQAGAEFALVNAGGLRSDLRYVSARAGDVLYNEVYSAQPFGNALVTMTVSGAAVRRAVASAMYDGEGLLQVSQQVALRWSAGKLLSLSVSGVPLDDARRYRVTVNEYMAGAAPWKSGGERVVGMRDTDALERYLASAVRSPSVVLAPRMRKE